MHVFTLPEGTFDEGNIDKQVIRHLIKKHRTGVERLEMLKKYYKGEHKILGESGRENKLVCNHSKDIADTASAYFLGSPIVYKSKENIEILLDCMRIAGTGKTDRDNALDLSVYGRAYEYIYTKSNDTTLLTKNLSPKNTFVVRDNSIEENELFAVYYYAKKDSSDRTNTQYVATVLTENYKYVINIEDTDEAQTTTEKPEEHFKGEVPVIEYLNNKLAIGDYELQIPLIDAYNALMSDRVTDKEQFIDAILALYGALLSDEDDEEEGDGNGSSSAMRDLKKEKLLELPKDAKAEYLTRTFDESGVEILKKAIEQDIHKFSHIPCMSDESFGGNVSGVAMEYKLLGMENITKIKTDYYREGLEKRLRIFTHHLAIKKSATIDYQQITTVFTRSLPKDLLSISQWVSNLWGKVSKKTLLTQIPFVDDVDEELKALEKENEEAMKQQQKMFGIDSNTPPEDDEGKDVDDKKKKGEVNE